MLHTDPVPRLDGDRYARVFRRRPSLGASHPSGRPYQTEAFHWGSLTTGHWLTSLWMLLAPFALANVAGWMARRRGPLNRSLVRVAGLALTALFVVQVGYVLVGVPIAFALESGWGPTAMTMTRLGGALGWVLVFGAIVLRLSTQSHFDSLAYRDRFDLLFTPTIAAMAPPRRDDGTQPEGTAGADTFDDPAASAVSDPALWRTHSILHRLRRIHFATGQLVIALVLARVQGNDTLLWMSCAGLAVAVALIAATGFTPRSRVVLGATAWATVVAEAIAVAAVALFVLSDRPPDLEAIHHATFHIAIALGLAAALCLAAGIPLVGALTFATFLGGAFGVGAGLVAEDMLSTGDHLIAQGGAWVAPASLIFLLFIALVSLVLMFRPPPPLVDQGLFNRLLTRLTRRSRLLLGAAALFGLAAGVLAVVEGCLRSAGICEPEALREITVADTVVVVMLCAVLVGAAILVARWRWKLASGLVAAAAAVAWVSTAEPVVVGVDLASYLRAMPLARTLIFVAPFVAILRSVIGAYRQGASSRKVGVIWDVASFWPRWFHPLGPPAYGPKVVDELTRLIRSGSVDILAGHSQGSVIAAIATDQADDGERPPVSGLLTYGSPIAMLYGKLFPDTGMADLTARLPGRLNRGWSNIWRVDDPIGGEHLGGDVEAVFDEDGSGHSGYELGTAYRHTRDRLA